MYMVLTGRRITPYRRILLGLSVSDFLCSLVYPWQAFLVPSDTSSTVWAIGNDQTCTFLGFGQQIFFTSIIYNSMLSLYFLLSVRFGISNAMIAKHYEVFMHLLPVGWSLVTALIGIGLGVFHELPLGQGCWIHDYPEGCGGSDCKDHWIALVFGGIPAIAAFLMIVINNLLVFLHVRNTIQRSRRLFRRSVPTISGANSSGVVSASSANASHDSDDNNNANNNAEPRNAEGQSTSSPFARTKSLSASFIIRRRKKKLKSKDAQLQRIREVARQATFYVVAFMATYLTSGVVQILGAYGYDRNDERALFPLLVLQALFLPSQGFFNHLVYIRPSLLRTRRDYPNESWWWVYRRALLGERIQPTKDAVKRRPSSSDFGLLIDIYVHGSTPVRRSTDQRPILQSIGMANNQYEQHWTKDDVDSLNNLGGIGNRGHFMDVVQLDVDDNHNPSADDGAGSNVTSNDDNHSPNVVVQTTNDHDHDGEVGPDAHGPSRTCEEDGKADALLSPPSSLEKL